MATTKEELKAQADDLGLTVTRSDGGSGEPTIADYNDAITAAMTAVPTSSSRPSDARSFIVRSPFKIFDYKRGQTIKGTVEEHDETGAEILVVGSDWAVLAPLLEAGWLEEVKG